MGLTTAATGALLVVVALVSQAAAALPPRPVVVAHRGASGLLPEHTMPAYQLAIAQGADFIECDVLATRDLQLVCRHDPALDNTTDAALHFGDRTTTHTIDGEQVTGVFAADLTLAELRQLRAKQRWEFRDTSHDGQYGLVTFDEFLDAALSAPAGRAVGVYPEAKHPAWQNALPALRAANTTIEALMVAALHARGYAALAPFGSAEWQRQPVFIQSYEVSSLQRFAALTRVPLALLIDPSGDPDSGLSLEQMTTDGFLGRLSHYVTVVAPSKGALVRSAEAPAAAAAGGGQAGQDTSSIGVSRVVLESGRFPSQQQQQQQQHSVLQSTGLAEQLHRHGFQVHTYTVRDEPRFVLPVCKGVVACELQLLFEVVRLDGGFADFPGTMVAHFGRGRS